MQLPSVQLDNVVEDHIGATQAQLASIESAPFSLVDGLLLDLTLGGSATVTFKANDFYDITHATLEEVIAAIRPTVLSLGGEVFRTDDSFGIRHRVYGASSTVTASGYASIVLGISGTATGVDSPGFVLVANRNPQPGEAQISLTPVIEFDVIDSTLASASSDDFVVSVDGLVAWSGAPSSGSFSNNFYGSIASGSPDAASTRFALQGGSFDSGQTVTVAVSLAGQTLATWSFVTYDVVPPLIAGVAAQNKDQIRVDFSEPVAMRDASASNDALNPANYLIERVSRPASTPEVLRVERVSDTAVLLTTTFELSFGAQYLLIVSGVVDEFDNVFLAPDNAAEFLGWLPPFPDGRRFLIHEFVPSVALGSDETDDLRLFLGCIQDTVNLLLHTVDAWAEILDPDLAPEPFLDAMLADLGNPFDFELTLEAKRKLAKILVRIYQLIGTVPGIVDTIRFFLGIEVSVEIFNGRGWRLGVDKLSDPAVLAKPNPIRVGAGGRARYALRIVTDELLTDEQREQILRIANFMKAAPDHIVGVRDATPKPISYRYWKTGYTKLGYAKLANG